MSFKPCILYPISSRVGVLSQVISPVTCSFNNKILFTLFNLLTVLFLYLWRNFHTTRKTTEDLFSLNLMRMKIELFNQDPTDQSILMFNDKFNFISRYSLQTLQLQNSLLPNWVRFTILMLFNVSNKLCLLV